MTPRHPHLPYTMCLSTPGRNLRLKDPHVGDIAARAQRRKPESCTVRTLLFPLAAIPENDRQRNSKEEGANCTGLRRHPMAGVASAPWGPPPTVGHISVARLPAAGALASIRGISKMFFYVASRVAYVLYMYMDSLMCNKSKKRSTARAQRG